MAPRTIVSPEVLGTSTQVTVVHYENPGDFWVAMTRNDSVLHSLQERMQSYCKESSQTSQTWRIGDFCSAQSTFDSVWYRAIVTAEPVSGLCAVFLVDFGRAEKLPLSRLRLLKPEFFDVPRLATRCSLQSIKPADPSRPSWSTKSIQSCRDMLAVAYPLQCQFTRKLPISNLDGAPCYEVVIIDKDRSLNPAVQLVQCGLAWLNIDEEQLGEPKCFLDMVKKVYPVLNLTNTSCEVTFSTFRTLSDFYVQQSFRCDELQMLKNRISQDVSKTMIMTSPSVEIGGACLAPYNDSKYYRAIFLDCSLETCQVFYVDYGNTASVVRSSCLPVLNHLRVENIFAHKCCLHGVRVVEGKDYKESVTIAERIQAEIHKLNSSSAYCTFHGQKQGVYDVTIFCGSQNFAEHLQSLGLVHYVNSVQSPPSNRALKSPRRENLYGRSSCINQRFVNPTLTIQPGMYEAVSVVAVKSPQEFYVWLSKIAAENQSLSESLNASYTQTPTPPVDFSALTLSCAVVVRWQRRFYRASVREICESHIMAKLVDYGHVVKVFPHDVFECMPEFVVPLSQAIACSLHGFDELPLPDRIKRKMEDLCLERQHFAKILGINDRQFVEVVLFLSDGQDNYINVNEVLMKALREDTNRRPQSLPSDELRRMTHLRIGEHRNLPSNRKSGDFERSLPTRHTEKTPYGATSTREAANCVASIDAVEADGWGGDDKPSPGYDGQTDGQSLDSPSFAENRWDNHFQPVQRRGRIGYRGNSRGNSLMANTRYPYDQGWSPDYINQTAFGEDSTDSQSNYGARRVRRGRGPSRQQTGRATAFGGSRTGRVYNAIRGSGISSSQNGWAPEEFSSAPDCVPEEDAVVHSEGRDRRPSGRFFHSASDGTQQSSRPSRGFDRSSYGHRQSEEAQTYQRPLRFNDQGGYRTFESEESQSPGRQYRSGYDDARSAFRSYRGTERTSFHGTNQQHQPRSYRGGERGGHRGPEECPPSRGSRRGGYGNHEDGQMSLRPSRGSERGRSTTYDGRSRGRGRVRDADHAQTWSAERNIPPGVPEKLAEGWDDEPSGGEDSCMDSAAESASKVSSVLSAPVSETAQPPASRRSVTFKVAELISGSQIKIKLLSVDGVEDPTAIHELLGQYERLAVVDNCWRVNDGTLNQADTCIHLRVNLVGLPDLPFSKPTNLTGQFHGDIEPNTARLSCEELKTLLTDNWLIDGYEICRLPSIPIPDQAVNVSVLPMAHGLHVQLPSMLAERTELDAEMNAISKLSPEQRLSVPIRAGVYAVACPNDESPERVLLISVDERDNSATVFCIDKGNYEFDVPLSCLSGLTPKLWEIPPLALRCSCSYSNDDNETSVTFFDGKKVKFMTKYPPYLLDEDYSDTEVCQMPKALIWPGDLVYAFVGRDGQIVVRLAHCAPPQISYDSNDGAANVENLVIASIGGKWYRAEVCVKRSTYNLVDMGIYDVDPSHLDKVERMPKRLIHYPQMSQVVKVNRPDKVTPGRLYAVEIVDFVDFTVNLHPRPISGEIQDILDNGFFVLDDEFCRVYKDLLHLLPDNSKSPTPSQLCRRVFVGCSYEEPLIPDCVDYLKALDRASDDLAEMEETGRPEDHLLDRIHALVEKYRTCEAPDEVFAVSHHRCRLINAGEYVDVDSGEIIPGGPRYRLPEAIIRIPPLIEEKTMRCIDSLLENIDFVLSE